jgi:hypothetical protein
MMSDSLVPCLSVFVSQKRKVDGRLIVLTSLSNRSVQVGKRPQQPHEFGVNLSYFFTAVGCRLLRSLGPVTFGKLLNIFF